MMQKKKTIKKQKVISTPLTVALNITSQNGTEPIITVKTERTIFFQLCCLGNYDYSMIHVINVCNHNVHNYTYIYYLSLFH